MYRYVQTASPFESGSPWKNVSIVSLQIKNKQWCSLPVKHGDPRTPCFLWNWYDVFIVLSRKRLITHHHHVSSSFWLITPWYIHVLKPTVCVTFDFRRKTISHTCEYSNPHVIPMLSLCYPYVWWIFVANPMRFLSLSQCWRPPSEPPARSAGSTVHLNLESQEQHLIFWEFLRYVVQQKRPEKKKKNAKPPKEAAMHVKSSSGCISWKVSEGCGKSLRVVTLWKKRSKRSSNGDDPVLSTLRHNLITVKHGETRWNRAKNNFATISHILVSSKSYTTLLKQTASHHDSAAQEARKTCLPSNPLKQTEEQSHFVELLPARHAIGFANEAAQIQEANHQVALPSALDPVHHVPTASWSWSNV